MRALCAGHAGGNRGEYQNAFQSFAENENADIEKRNRRARVRLGRIRRAVRGDSLPDHHPHDRDRGRENADPKNDAPRALALAQSSRTHDEKLSTVVNRLLPVGCVFLAAICTASLALSSPSASEGISRKVIDHAKCPA